MGLYGDAAILATRRVNQQAALSPQSAWDAAIKEYSDSTESHKKGCPRAAYLGLCDAGVVKGIKPGSGDRSKNGAYAVSAHSLLLSDPTLAVNRKQLWTRVCPEAKYENGQMDVVVSLWESRLLRGS
jgi:hypothetical protein